MVEFIRPDLDRVVDRFGAAMGDLGQVFESSGQFDPSPAALERLEAALSGPVGRVNASTAELTRLWTTIERVFSDVLAIEPYLPEGVDRDELRRSVAELGVSLQVPGLDDAEHIVGLLSALSRHLRPASRALAEALRVLRTMQRSVQDWTSQLG